MKLNVIQDIATPHNNVLLAALAKCADVDLQLWYCEGKTKAYGGNEALMNEVKEASLYKADRIDWGFVKYVWNHSQEKFLMVGWMNPTTRILLLMFWILRRPFNMWFDFPQDDKLRSLSRNVVREVMYFLVKTARCKVFTVGRMTVEYFIQRGFSAERLVNLPIFVDIDKTKADFATQRDGIRKKYRVHAEGLLLSTGSRLVQEKGFDVLVGAIAALPEAARKNVVCVIVGKGEEKENLMQMIGEYYLQDRVILEEWMDFSDFQALIAASDAFVHPARFDAFGGSIFALALGTPVIGSATAGAVIDRVVDGKNGYVYEDNNPDNLARLLVHCLKHPDKLAAMGPEARKTAMQWHPDEGAKIVKENVR